MKESKKRKKGRFMTALPKSQTHKASHQRAKSIDELTKDYFTSVKTNLDRGDITLGKQVGDYLNAVRGTQDAKDALRSFANEWVTYAKEITSKSQPLYWHEPTPSGKNLAALYNTIFDVLVQFSRGYKHSFLDTPTEADNPASTPRETIAQMIETSTTAFIHAQTNPEFIEPIDGHLHRAGFPEGMIYRMKGIGPWKKKEYLSPKEIAANVRSYMRVNNPE